PPGGYGDGAGLPSPAGRRPSGPGPGGGWLPRGVRAGGAPSGHGGRHRLAPPLAGTGPLPGGAPAPGVGGGPGPGGGGQRPLPVPPGDGDGGGVDGGGGGRFDPGPLRPGGPARAGSAPPPSPGGRLAPTPAVAQGTQLRLRLLGDSLGGREPPPGRAGVSEERFCAIAKKFSAGKGPRKGS